MEYLISIVGECLDVVEIMRDTSFSFKHIDMRKLGGTNARAGFA